MKKGLILLALGAWIGATATPARSQMVTPITRQTLDLKLPQTTADEEMLAVARASQANFIADSTRWPQRPVQANTEWRATLWEWLRQFQSNNRLALTQTDDRTFLFWAQPNLSELSQLIATGATVRKTGVTATTAELGELVLPYLRHEFGWPRKEGEPEIRIRVVDLPPAIRPQLVAHIQQYGLAEAGIIPVRRAWFDDKTWEHARLLTKVVNSLGKKREYLAVEQTIPQGGREAISLVFFDTLPRTEAERRVLVRKAQAAETGTPAADAAEAAVVPVIAQPKDRTQPPADITALDLPREGAFQSKVSLTASRLPLMEFLAGVSAKTPVTLRVAADFPPARLTAHLHEMPLVSLMQSLSRLYGSRWRQDGDAAYTLMPTHFSHFEQLLLQTGDMTGLKERVLSSPLVAAITLEVATHNVQPPQLNPPGILVADLPEDLRYNVRRYVEQRAAVNLLQDYMLASETYIVDQGYVIATPNSLVAGFDNPSVRQPIMRLEAANAAPTTPVADAR